MTLSTGSAAFHLCNVLCLQHYTHFRVSSPHSTGEARKALARVKEAKEKKSKDAMNSFEPHTFERGIPENMALKVNLQIPALLARHLASIFIWSLMKLMTVWLVGN